MGREREKVTAALPNTNISSNISFFIIISSSILSIINNNNTTRRTVS